MYNRQPSVACDPTVTDCEAGEWRGDRLQIKGMLSAVEPASAIKCRANAYYNIKKRPFMRETTSSGIFR